MRPLPAVLLALGLAGAPAIASEVPGASVSESFKKEIRPILVEKCFGCHADGGDSGGISFDTLETQGRLLDNTGVWFRVLKNVRAGIMPPEDADPLTPAEKATLDQWIKRQAFGLDPAHPDPGRVTLRRLNRVEYQNTIRDLTGVRFNVDEEFPPDDTGHGFDNIADVLTLSPMLLEKYMAAASTVIAKAVPAVPLEVAETRIPGGRFTRIAADGAAKPGKSDDRLTLSYYEPATARHTFAIKTPGTYRVVLEYMAQGRYAEKAFDYNRAAVAFTIDGNEVHQREFGWQNKNELRYEYEYLWTPGDHTVQFEVKPLTDDKNRPGELRFHLQAVRLVGPLEKEHWVKPRGHEKWFGKDPIPADLEGRRARATAILTSFATNAFRRPVDAETVSRLVSLAERFYGDGKQPFEAGISHAMVAVLASPRFLFREETTLPPSPGERHPLLDEYALAVRLSYFLWSSTPDAELLRLAGEGKLRASLRPQVERMLADGRAQAFFQNFPGQWLQARDVEQVAIERTRVMDRSSLKALKVTSDGEWGTIRWAMREETERYFAHVVKENRSVLEFVDSNYTFLNDKLAEFYGVPGVTGGFKKVQLPPDSPRGGVLTMGTTLLVTSNPTRTSPVKRGLFLLENIIGTPPPPPPPNIPSLEEAGKSIKDKTPTLRQTLEMHRSNPDCMSCHTRLDPPGLALENFNAMGVWRDLEKDVPQPKYRDGKRIEPPDTSPDPGRPIDATGKLITGEPFKDIRELKKILVANHKQDIYRCLTEKLMTYALGRGVEYYDTETVDQIVAALDRDGGRFHTLLMGIIESPAFQRRRSGPDAPEPPSAREENSTASSQSR